MHPRAGAVAVGARPFLIAWNVNLGSDDKKLAQRIVGASANSGGGLPAVQALGMDLEEPERGNPRFAQVSMNLLDFRRTPVWRVYEMVEELANEEGVGVTESELIGLMPQEAFLDVADHLGVPDGRPPRGADPAGGWLDQAPRLRPADGAGAAAGRRPVGAVLSARRPPGTAT